MSAPDICAEFLARRKALATTLLDREATAPGRWGLRAMMLGGRCLFRLEPQHKVLSAARLTPEQVRTATLYGQWFRWITYVPDDGPSELYRFIVYQCADDPLCPRTPDEDRRMLVGPLNLDRDRLACSLLMLPLLQQPLDVLRSIRDEVCALHPPPPPPPPLV